MVNRSPVSVFFLGLFTAGIYHLIWVVKTKGEMNDRGANIPTAWMLLLFPISLIWVWKYCQGVQKVTNGGMGAAMAFLIYLFAGPLGPSILQSQFNKVGAAAAPAAAAPAPAARAPAPAAPAEEPAAPPEEEGEQESGGDDEEKSES